MIVDAEPQQPPGLRNHIPVPGPATREPLRGDEPPVRLSLGFHPRWYAARFEVDFGQRWHTDPIYRHATLTKIKSALHRAYPEIDNFDPVDHAGGADTCATLSGVHGVMVLPMLYGLGVAYAADQFPDSIDARFLAKRELSAMRPICLESQPMVEQLLAQMDLIEREWGTVHGYLNYQGILNVAFKLRGQEIMLDLVDDAAFARDLFAHIAEASLAFARLVQARQRTSGFPIDLYSTSNCVINLVSPEVYGAFILPHDLRLSEAFARFGVHTCDWNVTPYIGQLSTIANLGYLDMGINSDLSLVRKTFPATRRAVLLNSNLLTDRPPAEVESIVRRIVRDLAPCDIAMGSIDVATPDTAVHWFVRLIHDAWEMKEREAC
jgi:hypothetical protein